MMLKYRRGLCNFGVYEHFVYKIILDILLLLVYNIIAIMISLFDAQGVECV